MLLKQDYIKMRLANEIAWTSCNAIVDSDDSELTSLTLKQLVKIRDIIETETNAIINNLNERENGKL